jgi:hypothetical protein
MKRVFLFLVIGAVVASGLMAAVRVTRRIPAFQANEPVAWEAASDCPRETYLRQHPLVIEPPGDLAAVVPRKELENILALLEPCWEYWRASDLLHALRLWGPTATFPETPPFPVPDGVRAITSSEMLGFFLNESQYRHRFPNAPPYFYQTRHGLGVREGRNPSVTVHRDDFSALAAELGISIDTPLHWAPTARPLRAVLEHSLKWYHPQQELEFTAVAYAHYLAAGTRWVDRFGAEHDLNEVVERLLAADLKGGSCYATHVPYALAVFVAAHAQEPLLDQSVLKRAEMALQSFSRELQERQGGAGYWGRQWCQARSSVLAIESEMLEWLRSTGHHLEWISLVRPELRPPEQNVRRAARFLLNILSKLEKGNLPRGMHYNELSHAARALVLLSGERFASEVMIANWERRARK